MTRAEARALGAEDGALEGIESNTWGNDGWGIG